MKEIEETETQKKGNPNWFIGAALSLAFLAATGGFEWHGGEGNVAAFSYLAGTLIVPVLLVVNGVRTYQGKATHFWKMFACIILVLLFITYVLPG